MRNNTKLFSLLRWCFNTRGSSFTAREVSDNTAIKINHVPAYAKALDSFIKKKRIDGKMRYSMTGNVKQLRRARYLLKNATRDKKPAQVIIEKPVRVEVEKKYTRKIIPKERV
ncbi:MAG: hypothetical protein ABH864_05190 [archaeon]